MNYGVGNPYQTPSTGQPQQQPNGSFAARPNPAPQQPPSKPQMSESRFKLSQAIIDAMERNAQAQPVQSPWQAFGNASLQMAKAYNKRRAPNVQKSKGRIPPYPINPRK